MTQLYNEANRYRYIARPSAYESTIPAAVESKPAPTLPTDEGELTSP